MPTCFDKASKGEGGSPLHSRGSVFSRKADSQWGKNHPRKLGALCLGGQGPELAATVYTLNKLLNL